MRYRTLRRLPLKRWLMLFSAAWLAGSFISVTILAEPSSAEVTIQSCYDEFNGKSGPSIGLSPNYTDCFSVKRYCSAGSNAAAPITCVKDTAVNSGTQAADVLYNPLKTLICGSGAGGDAAISAYQACANSVTLSGASCFYNETGATGVKDSQSIATCLNVIYPTYSLDDLLAAVNAGKTNSQAVLDAAAAAAAEQACLDDPEAAGCGDSKPTCTINGVGWIICPVAELLGNMADGAKDQVDGLMRVRTTELFPSGGTAYTAWASARSIANVMFAMAFIAIIYSQITGAGLSNYGIKKMLPRLIIASVLINASWVLCVAAIDISNVVGAGASTLIAPGGTGSPIRITSPATDAGPSQTGEGFAGMVGIALVIGVTGYFFLGAILSIITYVVVMLVVLLFLLGMREALLIMAVIASPLAFAAWLLPNTEGFFKKWWDLFKLLLMAYPIIGALYGIGMLASTVLMAVDDWRIQVIGIIVMFIWIIFLKTILVAATAIGGASAKLEQLGGKARGGLDEKVKGSAIGQFADYRKKQSGINRALAQGGKYTGKNRVRRMQSFASKGINRVAPGNFGSHREGVGKQVQNKELEEETERQQETMGKMNADQLLAHAKDTGKSAESRAAALRQLTEVGGHQHIQAAYDYLMGAGANGEKGIDDVQQLAAGALAKRKPAGVSATDVSKMRNGTMGRGQDAGSYGYNSQLLHRLREGKFSEQDFANMDVDDHARFAQMQAAGLLTSSDRDNLAALTARVDQNDNIALSDEKRHAINQAVTGAVGGTPSSLTGREYGELAPLRQTIAAPALVGSSPSSGGSVPSSPPTGGSSTPPPPSSGGIPGLKGSSNPAWGSSGNSSPPPPGGKGNSNPPWNGGSNPPSGNP